MASPVTGERGRRVSGISRAVLAYAPQVPHAGVMGRTAHLATRHLDGSQKQRSLLFGTMWRNPNACRRCCDERFGRWAPSEGARPARAPGGAAVRRRCGRRGGRPSAGQCRHRSHRPDRCCEPGHGDGRRAADRADRRRGLDAGPRRQHGVRRRQVREGPPGGVGARHERDRASEPARVRHHHRQPHHVLRPHVERRGPCPGRVGRRHDLVRRRRLHAGRWPEPLACRCVRRPDRCVEAVRAADQQHGHVARVQWEPALRRR